MGRIGCGLCLLPLLAGAQERAPVEPLYALNLDQLLNVPVSTASRTDEPLRYAAGTVLVLTREDLRERGYRHLGELLRALPGVEVQGYANATFYNRVSWRGLSGNNKFLILQNGVRIAAPAGEPIPIADNFPLYHVQRVEIVYGPASALYGADALTGVINFITDTEVGGEAAQLTLEGGDAAYARASVRGRVSRERLRLSAGAQRQRADNTDLSRAYPDRFPMGNLYDFDGVTVRVPADQRQPYHGDTSSAQAYIDARLGERLQLGYNGSHFRHPSTANDRSAYVDYGGNWTTDLHAVYGRYRFALGEQVWGEVMANHARYEVAPESRFNNLFSGFAAGYKYAESQRRQVELVLHYQWAETQALTGGVVAERVHALPKTADLSHPYIAGLSPQEQGLYYAGTNNTLPVRIFEVDYHDAGAFLQQQSTWSARLRTVAGVRYDHYSNFGSSTNPRLALILQPTDAHKLSLLYGEAFLAPSPYFTYEHFGSFNGTQDAQGRYQSFAMFVPNTALGPEQVQTWQLDGSWLLNAHWELAATGYRNRLSGLILPVRTDPTLSDFVPGGTLLATFYNANRGAIEVDGLELRVDHWQHYAPGRLRAWASYNYQDGQQTSPAGREALPFVAQHNVKLGLSWAWGEHYSLSPSLYAASPMRSPAGGGRADSYRHAPGYAVVDLYARADKLRPGLSLFLRVQNLFDRRWYNAGSGADLSFVASPQDRRRASLGLEWAY